MGWVWLALAGIAEIGWMVFLRFSDGFSNLLWAALMLATMALSLLFLSFAIRTVPMGMAYAIVGGIAATGIALVGIAMFNEPRTALHITSIGMIVAGIAGLRIASF